MASYHRVLAIFDRSVHDKNNECDIDVHPWELRVNDQRWFGKIRLIGFVDVFFLICYSTHDRFKHGIIIYKEDDIIRQILASANQTDTIKPNEPRDEGTPPKYFSFTDGLGDLDYVITSVGHPVGLRTEYQASEVQRYTIRLRRPRDFSFRGPVIRGINQHSIPELIQDVLRLGIVSNAELTASLLKKFASGTHAEDTTRKWLRAISGGGNEAGKPMA